MKRSPALPQGSTKPSKKSSTSGITWRHPEFFGSSIQKPDPSAMLVLGLDPGTKCGFAYGFILPGGKVKYPTNITMGVWSLKLSEYDSGAMRWLRLRGYLQAARLAGLALVLMEGRDIGAIAAYRMPRQKVLTGMKASDLLAGAKATVATWCEMKKIACGAVAIQKIKKRATDKGNANKEDVILACNREFGTDFDSELYQHTGDDNRADAAFVCALALEEYAEGLL